jgi:hypothetical protein
MAMRRLLGAKVMRFEGKSQFEAFSEFFKWYEKNQNICILAIADYQDDVELETPNFVVVC